MGTAPWRTEVAGPGWGWPCWTCRSGGCSAGAHLAPPCPTPVAVTVGPARTLPCCRWHFSPSPLVPTSTPSPSAYVSPTRCWLFALPGEGNGIKCQGVPGTPLLVPRRVMLSSSPQAPPGTLLPAAGSLAQCTCGCRVPHMLALGSVPSAPSGCRQLQVPSIARPAWTRLCPLVDPMGRVWVGTQGRACGAESILTGTSRAFHPHGDAVGVVMPSSR